jgi:hypothetical protein
VLDVALAVRNRQRGSAMGFEMGEVVVVEFHEGCLPGEFGN